MSKKSLKVGPKKTTTVRFRAEPKFINRIAAAAERDGRTLSSFVRAACDEKSASRTTNRRV